MFLLNFHFRKTAYIEITFTHVNETKKPNLNDSLFTFIGIIYVAGAMR